MFNSGFAGSKSVVAKCLLPKCPLPKCHGSVFITDGVCLGLPEQTHIKIQNMVNLEN